MKNILFLCPHNAAKSVLSAALMQRASDENNLGLTIQTGGTDPDEAVAAKVRARIEADGMTTDVIPKVATADQFEAADIVINIGCDYEKLATSDPVTDWKIPNFSEDFELAHAAIVSHVASLVEELKA